MSCLALFLLDSFLASGSSSATPPLWWLALAKMFTMLSSIFMVSHPNELGVCVCAHVCVCEC